MMVTANLPPLVFLGLGSCGSSGGGGGGGCGCGGGGSNPNSPFVKYQESRIFAGNLSYGHEAK